MRYFVTSTFICVCLLVLAANTFGQQPGDGCLPSPDTGKHADGNYYTNCFPWVSGDGTTTVTIGGTTYTKNDDTARLVRAIGYGYRKLVFNEPNYFIKGKLPLRAFMVIEGKVNNTTSGAATSYITQTLASTPIFEIAPVPGSNPALGQGIIQEIAIRDIGLNGNNLAGTTGIYATGGVATPATQTTPAVLNPPGLFFQFSNIRFSNFERGIYVNATDDGYWQFDNVRLDRCTFENNRIGVHINSMNSGWSITSINMKVPAEPQYPTTATETMGFYFERSTYTQVNMVQGNGPSDLAGSLRAGNFIKIVRHGNIGIQNVVSEGFKLDLVIDGINSTTKNFPIALINNHFMHGVTIKYATVMSTGNQFGYYDPPLNQVAIADVTDDSVVYSFGDKFCFEGQTCVSGGNDYSKYRTVGPNAKLLASIGDSLSLTSKTASDGLTFNGNYSPFTLNDTNLRFGNNGTITLGSTVFVNMNLGTTTPGTMYFCWDCKANATTGNCEGSGTGAFAKKLTPSYDTTWKCN